MRNFVRSLGIAFGLAGSAAAQDVPQASPQDIATQLAALQSVPGAAAGWVTAEAMEVAVAGNRVVDGEDAVQAGDAWHVGSITKGMTATLAARMVEAAAITWDTRIGAVLGDAFPEMHADWHDTPLRALLSHQSGMAANLPSASAVDLGEGPRHDYVAEMLYSQPETAVGEFVYSNAGYVVAGAMLEAVGGAPWEELMQEHVFGPLGMESAGFGPPQGAAIEGHATRLLRGVRSAGQGPEADNIPAMGPAGRVHLSAGDMLRYLRAHLVRDESFLSPATWEVLHTAAGDRGYSDSIEGYAMGWGVDENGNLVHAGSNTFWYAVAYIDPSAGVAVFAATNSGDLRAVAEPVDGALRALLVGR
ncbi:beta-lactamase family protein [Rhodobacteraceae bacterium M385]|nr:beta-lactamase family protein [Rhodobacteraceae bacterium M385]